MHYESLGGGFVKAIDISSNKELDPVSYNKSRTTETLCYIYDTAKPMHCLEDKSCKNSPLFVEQRITRSKHVLVQFDGWVDKPAPRANKSSASGIDFYEISMHEVSNGKVSLSSSYSANISKTVTSHTININTTLPKLYCIKLAVKDIANNVKYARRFVLYDNTSIIKTRQNSSMFYVTSASKETNYNWQQHHEQICMTWNGFFYNDFYIQNPLLNEIQPDSDFSGIYDQTTGLIPVNGTENVNGIVRFTFSWSGNNGSYSKETLVPNIMKQFYCTTLNMKDGEAYTFLLKAEDIMNNSLTENRTVYVDRSAPIIENIWLTKDDEEQIFVHDSKDLSKMKISFKTFDRHSGLRTIQWSFGTNEFEGSLINGNIKVNTVREVCILIMK